MPQHNRKAPARKTGGHQSISHKSPASEETTPKISIVKKSIPPRPSAKKKIKSKPSPPPVDISPPVKKPRAPRKKVTLESHLSKYDALMKLLDAEIERKRRESEKGTRVFRTVRKTVRELYNEAPKIATAKRRVAAGGKKVSGFVLKCSITDELADFMKLPHGSTPSRNEITNSICVYANIKPGETRPQMLKWENLNPGGLRNLQKPTDKMIIIPDDVLSKLLGYDKYVADVEGGLITKSAIDKTTRKKKMQTNSSLMPNVR